MKHLYGDPDKLRGLISGVKGKLFEMDYVKWLNDGHLPRGWTAELAHTANNPGWDIAIHDANGQVAELLQLKATAIMAYAREAIAVHPDIPVVVPHELYERLLSDHPEFLGHLLDGQQTLADLNDHVQDAAGHAEAVGDHLPFIAPAIAIAFAVAQNFIRYREGKTTFKEALQNVGGRGVLAVIATGAGWAVAIIPGAHLAGIPVAMGIRLFGRQLLHNRDRRELLTRYIETITSSTKVLENQLQRPLLEAAIE